MSQIETPKLSPRLKDALIADLLQDADDDLGDQLLLERFRDEYEWTEHLKRQLGLRAHGAGDVHETLKVLLPELGRLLREWPLPTDGKACRSLAEVATKSLLPVETYATLLSGPRRWRKPVLGQDVSVEHLDGRLRVVLQRALATSLNDMLGRWTAWEIPRLRQRWREAKARQSESREEVDETERAAARAERQRALRETREDRARWRRACYTPPGRTT
jgi:hypothetical protein